jgi:hypothetical protein
VAAALVRIAQAGNLLTPEMLLSMERDPIVFACANPMPEIDPEIGDPDITCRLLQSSDRYVPSLAAARTPSIS